MNVISKSLLLYLAKGQILTVNGKVAFPLEIYERNGKLLEVESSSVLLICHSLKVLLYYLAEILVENTKTLHRCCYLVTKWFPTFLWPWDCSLTGSSVHGISQARILEWVATYFSRGSSWPRDWICISCIGRQILYHWALREAQNTAYQKLMVCEKTNELKRIKKSMVSKLNFEKLPCWKEFVVI